MRKRIFVGLILLVTTGCYSYVPAELGVVPVGEGVRVYLSRAGVAKLSELTGDEIPGSGGDQPLVQGTLVRRTDSEFSILVPVASRQVGFLQTNLGQQVTFPVADAVQVQLRKISPVKTGLALIGSTAGIAYLIVSIVQGARQPSNPSPDPGPVDLRAPLVLTVP
ncbi:MAG: hypothetical protein EXR93_12595 [Gemmatimonadetes bacterium]|nr:hypothetical protein [Gemmatimonadota bacterium]